MRMTADLKKRYALHSVGLSWRYVLSLIVASAQIACLLLLSFAGHGALATEVAAAPASQPAEIGELTRTLQLFLLVGGAFIGVVATVGFVFFGFDVRRAKHELEDGRKELRKQRDEVSALRKEILDSAEELRTKHRELSESIASHEAEIEDFVAAAEERVGRIASEIEAASSDGDEVVVARRAIEDEANDTKAVMQVIEGSKFTWTSIGRISNKTGFERDAILRLARRSPEIRIGVGKKTGDHIFRIEGA
ncbi:MAG: hypothetical protein HOI95_23175 [Chromatiales bacterium]|nr:hypothetical protein [Chromatiales bacterium]